MICTGQESPERCGNKKRSGTNMCPIRMIVRSLRKKNTGSIKDHPPVHFQNSSILCKPEIYTKQQRQQNQKPICRSLHPALPPLSRSVKSLPNYRRRACREDRTRGPQRDACQRQGRNRGLPVPAEDGTQGQARFRPPCIISLEGPPRIFRAGMALPLKMDHVPRPFPPNTKAGRAFWRPVAAGHGRYDAAALFFFVILR